MEPQKESQEPQLIIRQNKIVIKEQYNGNPLNYQTTFIKIKDSLQDNKQIGQFSWRWANKLTEEQIIRLINILPQRMTNFCLSGSMSITGRCLSEVGKKFKDLKNLNVFCEASTFDQAQEGIQNFKWQLNFQINIKNDMKNFRQFQKWCNSVSKSSQNQMNVMFLNSLPSTIVSLSLRNIALGKNPVNIQTILITCPILQQLDIGQCQLTDQAFEGVNQQLLRGFGLQVRHLKIDCNRVTNRSFQCLFKDLFIESKQAKMYNNLEVLDISRTSMTKILGIIFQRLPQLLYLGFGVLEVTEKEIDEIHVKYIKSIVKQNLIELDLQYLTLSPKAFTQMLQLYPNLQNLTIANIQPKEDCKYSEELQFTGNSKLKRIDACYNAYFNDNVQGCNGGVGSLLNVIDALIVLKISGTRINQETLLNLCKNGKNIQWLEMSHLQQLEVNFIQIKNQQSTFKQKQMSGSQVMSQLQQLKIQGKKQQKVRNAYQLFSKILRMLVKLQYVQAYGLLTSSQVIAFKTEFCNCDKNKKRNVVAVIDTNGPIMLYL